jgi:hypothetical protein
VRDYYLARAVISKQFVDQVGLLVPTNEVLDDTSGTPNWTANDLTSSFKWTKKKTGKYY